MLCTVTPVGWSVLLIAKFFLANAAYIVSANVTMPSNKMSKAFVVKKLVSSTTSYVLVVNKKLLVANFASPQNLPEIGAVITIKYRYAEKLVDKMSTKMMIADKIYIENWVPYNGYNSMMLRLSSKPSDEVLRFTGDFYTCGCVRYKEKPLTNPALFNDVTGIVEDSRDVLDKKYVGKLYATVVYTEGSSEPKWELCYVDKYLKKEDVESGHFPYHGIVGALSKLSNKACYITSRDFPHDVRFFRGTNTDSVDVDSLLGREVQFHARKGVTTPFMSFYVLGAIEVGPKNPAAKIYFTSDSYFSLTLDVEYRGCTDDCGLTVVWSDKWEFVADPYNLFRNCEFGIYCVEIIRQFVSKQFPRWKVKRIVNVVRSYTSSKNDGCVLRPVERLSISPSIKISSERISVGDKGKGNSDDSGIDSREMEDGASSPKVIARTETPQNCEEEVQCRDVDEELELELQQYMHDCLKSVKVRAAMKQANPDLFEALVKAIMRV